VSPKGTVQVATIVATLGLILATVAVWLLIKRSGQKRSQDGPLGEHNDVAAIIDTPGLSADEKRKLRRHLAKKLEEERVKDPNKLKKPVDLEKILRSEEQRPRRRT